MVVNGNRQFETELVWMGIFYFNAFLEEFAFGSGNGRAGD